MTHTPGPPIHYNPLEDIESIKRTAGDIDFGYFEGKDSRKMRGNIGGIVSRACDRLTAWAASNAQSSPDIEGLMKNLEYALLGVNHVTSSEWDGGDSDLNIPDQKETRHVYPHGISMLTSSKHRNTDVNHDWRHTRLAQNPRHKYRLRSQVAAWEWSCA